MAAANPLGAYAHPSPSDIPYIEQCNKKHPSSFPAKITIFLLL
jgi:hypothetical protein